MDVRAPAILLAAAFLGDFDDLQEVRTLVVALTSNLAVTGTPTGVFVLTDSGVFRQILQP